MQGWLWRRDQESRDRRLLAWETARLTRAKHIPDLDRVLAGPPRRRRLSRDEQADYRARHAWLQESMHRHAAKLRR